MVEPSNDVSGIETVQVVQQVRACAAAVEHLISGQKPWMSEFCIVETVPSNRPDLVNTRKVYESCRETSAAMGSFAKRAKRISRSARCSKSTLKKFKRGCYAVDYDEFKTYMACGKRGW